MSIYSRNTFAIEENFIAESDKILSNIFTSCNINESEMMILREASIKDLFNRVKEFFKKLWGKIMEAIRNIRKKSVDNQKLLYDYYMKNQIAINYAFHKAKEGKITIEGEHNYYTDFGLDSTMTNRFRKLGVSRFSLSNIDSEYISRYAIKQPENVTKGNILGVDVEFKSSSQMDENELKEWVEANRAGAMKSILSTLRSISDGSTTLNKIYNMDDETDWDKVKQIARELYSGKEEPFTKDVAYSVYVNLEGIIKSGPSSSKALDSYNKILTDEYNAGMKNLEELEKALMSNENVIPERVPKVVNMYSSYFKYVLDKYLDMFNFMSSIRDRQIVTYLQVCKKLVKKMKSQGSKSQNESALFSSVQFI